MAEQETVEYFTVRVASYGNPEKLAADHLERLCRDLSYSFHSGTMVQCSDGRWWRYEGSRREGDRMVQCHPPELQLGQKPFKPKRLKFPRPKDMADVIPMNGKAGE